MLAIQKTLASGATLEVSGEGSAVFGGTLALGNGATLSFNFTDKRSAPVLDVTGGSSPAGLVKVRVTGNCPTRGVHALTAGGGFAGKRVVFDTGYGARLPGMKLVVNGAGNICLEGAH